MSDPCCVFWLYELFCFDDGLDIPLSKTTINVGAVLGDGSDLLDVYLNVLEEKQSYDDFLKSLRMPDASEYSKVYRYVDCSGVCDGSAEFVL